MTFFRSFWQLIKYSVRQRWSLPPLNRKSWELVVHGTRYFRYTLVFRWELNPPRVYDGRFLSPTADELWKTIFLERQDVLSRGRLNVTLSISMSLRASSYISVRRPICVMHTATSVINKIIIFSSLPPSLATKASVSTGSSRCRQAIFASKRVHEKGKEPH